MLAEVAHGHSHDDALVATRAEMQMRNLIPTAAAFMFLVGCSAPQQQATQLPIQPCTAGPGQCYDPDAAARFLKSIGDDPADAYVVTRPAPQPDVPSGSSFGERVSGVLAGLAYGAALGAALQPHPSVVTATCTHTGAFTTCTAQ
jgi:hypothetical protein